MRCNSAGFKAGPVRSGRFAMSMKERDVNSKAQLLERANSLLDEFRQLVNRLGMDKGAL